MFSTPETSVHVQDKNREISPLERERGKLWGKGSGEKVSFKTRMEDPVRHANYRFRSRVGAWQWQWRRVLLGGVVIKLLRVAIYRREYVHNGLPYADGLSAI